MRHNVVLHKELTKARFGYLPENLNKGSHNVVVVECVNCHSKFEREYRNFSKKHQCPIVVGRKKRCFKCKQWKDLSLFNKCCNLSGGVSKLCKECYNKHDAVIRCELNRKIRIKHSFRNDINFYIKRRSYYIKSHAKRNNIPYDLDSDYLYGLWKLQQGKCFYSGLKMKAEGKIKGFQGWFSPSLDRKIPEMGYIKGNVVWCCFAINSFKQSLTDQQFLNIVKTINWKQN